MTYVIAQPCVDLKDRACVDECPVDCIYEGKRMLYIHPDECVDCGACEPVCPVEAIFYEDDTPEQWKDYYDANVALLRRPRLARWRRQDGRDRQGPPAHRGAAAAETQDRVTPPAAGSPRRLPGLPLGPARRRTPRGARAHPDGIVDLSVGTPVDPTPEVVQQALRARRRLAGLPADDRPRRRPGRPRIDWLARRYGVTGLGLDAVLPVIGSKELIGSLPSTSASAPGDLVVHPELAYPTYEVGAALAGARVRRHRLADRARARGAARCCGSTRRPTRPAGCCRVEHLRKVVDWCRERGTLLVSDECYLECALGGRARSRCCTPTSAAARTRASSRCTRCRSAPTWPATAARSSPATRRWSASCSPSARTSA